MIVSGFLQAAMDAVTSKLVQDIQLQTGQVLDGKVLEMGSEGKGTFKLSNGLNFSFQGGQGLQKGEAVKLQVVRSGREVSVRVMDTEGKAAARLAQAPEQSLAKAPDLFTRLSALAGQAPRARLEGGGYSQTPAPAASGQAAATPTSGGVPFPPGGPFASGPVAGTPATPFTAAGSGLFSAGGGAVASGLFTQAAGGGQGGGTTLPAFVTASGEPLSQILGKSLPTISVSELMKGSPETLTRLLSPVSGGGGAEAAQQLRQAAQTLQLPGGGSEAAAARAGGEAAAAGAQTPAAAELAAARTAVNGLSDLAALQDILPKSPPQADGTQLVGYRVFWLGEGGMGEAIWNQRQSTGRDGEKGETVTTALINLSMTNLGNVQAKLAYAEERLHVGLSAEREEALSRLRQGVGQLRERLNMAGLPLKGLEIGKLPDRKMRQERQKSLGPVGGYLATA